MVQQNPTATQVIGANIQEHQAMLYKIQIEQAMGQPLPTMEDGQMPPEVMNEIAMMATQATQQVTGQAQAMAQAEAQAQRDPQREMFEAQLQLEKEQLMQKEGKDQRDKDVEMMKAEMQGQLEREKIAAANEREEVKAAVDLQEAELRTQRDAEKNFTELVKTVRESKE